MTSPNLSGRCLTKLVRHLFPVYEDSGAEIDVSLAQVSVTDLMPDRLSASEQFHFAKVKPEYDLSQRARLHGSPRRRHCRPVVVFQNAVAFEHPRCMHLGHAKR